MDLLTIGKFQIAPNALYQAPIVEYLRSISGATNDSTGNYDSAIVPRNSADDPFAVLDNRKMYAAELLVVYDPQHNVDFGKKRTS